MESIGIVKRERREKGLRKRKMDLVW